MSDQPTYFEVGNVVHPNGQPGALHVVVGVHLSRAQGERIDVMCLDDGYHRARDHASEYARVEGVAYVGDAAPPTAADQPTTEPSAEQHEAVARAIDPDAFDFPEECAGDIDLAMVAADRVLALLAPAPQPAADTETEQSVRDAIAQQLEQVAERHSAEAARHRADSVAAVTLRGTRSHMATAQAYRNKASALYDAARIARGE